MKIRDRWLVCLLAIVALAGGLAGCAKGPAGAANIPVRVVNDDLQRRVNVPMEVKRVVSLAPSATEDVFSVGAGDRLVGVTTFCNYPDEARSIAKIGDTMNPNMETIVALKPDVVLVSTASQVEAFTRTLEENRIAVYVLDPTTLNDVFNSLERLAALLGTTDRLAKVVPDLRKRAADVELKAGSVAKSKVFVQISREPLFTIGKTAFLNDVIARAGGLSVTADVETAFPKLSKETASALDPDVIILSDSEDNQSPNEAFKNSPAVKKGRVYKINADIISRPGPRLVDALEAIAKDIHPELFK
jgi:iron complex transport system substrate-binding protein